MSVTEVDVAPLKRQYPHVDTVTDFSTQQSLKLLWDRVFSLQEQLTAAQATITTLTDSHNTNETILQRAARDAREALAQVQVSDPTAPTGTDPKGADDKPDDGGQADAGFSAGLPSGHDSGGLLTALRAGQIAGGTFNEFAALRNPTATVEERLTNAEEMIRRMIWHLQKAGFEAGRQKNPSGRISKDKLAVTVDGVSIAYDLFIDLEGFTTQMRGHMGSVGKGNMQSDAGIAD